MTIHSRTNWQSIFDRATLKAAQLRAGSFYIRSNQGNDLLNNALIAQEARAAEAAHQLLRMAGA